MGMKKKSVDYSLRQLRKLARGTIDRINESEYIVNHNGYSDWDKKPFKKRLKLDTKYYADLQFSISVLLKIQKAK